MNQYRIVTQQPKQTAFYVSPQRDPQNQNTSQQELEDITAVLEISQRESEENTKISNFIHDKDKLIGVLSTLPDVDPNDPRFEKFFT